jgi:aspartate aminotransferase-like enzyme
MVPEPKLLVPGPTPVPQAIFQAMITPMVAHRNAETVELHHRIVQGLQSLWSTEGPVILQSSSGSGALEASIVNACARGDRVLAVSAGAFGERFGTIATRLGMDVDWLRFPWGEATPADDIAAALRQKDYQAVLLIHNETSTGVLHPIPEIARAIRSLVPVIVVDSISGTPSVPTDIDPWGVDMVIATSQKGFMMPPGLGLVGLGREAQKHFRGEPSLYFDFGPSTTGQFHYTMPVSMIFALAKSVELLAEEGAETRYARHRLMSEMVCAGSAAMGFTVLGDMTRQSPTVTVIAPPDGVSNHDIRNFSHRHGLDLAGGIGQWADRALRVGHVGATGPLDMLMAINILELSLATVGNVPVDGRGSAAALKVWERHVKETEVEPVKA